MFGLKRTKLPVVVRVYEHRKAKKVAELFQKDAVRMDTDGYEVISVVGVDHKATMGILSGGIGLLAPMSLTVTYKLR